MCVTSLETAHRADHSWLHAARFPDVGSDFNRLTPKEREYMRGMAAVKTVLFSPQHGDTAFTVPMFDEFMKRALPASDGEMQ